MTGIERSWTMVCVYYSHVVLDVSRSVLLFVRVASVLYVASV